MPPITRALLRAPLRPTTGLARDLHEDPLGEAALALANPSLLHAPAPRALHRYARRAAFRATPHGLLAGVGMARLGDATEIDTGAPRARVRPSFARMRALALALLDDPRVRARTRLRVTPSLLRCGDRVVWLGPGEAIEAEVDPMLEKVLAATARWTPWPRVRRALGGRAAAADEVIAGMLADGLLLSELCPALVGPEADEQVRAQVGRPAVGRRDLRRELERIVALGDAGTAASIGEARAALAALPGAGEDAPLAGTLLFPRARATLARVAVDRAAALAPLLHRLAAALVPPVAERDLDPAVTDALAAVGEIFGAGAYDLGELALGGRGVPLGPPAEAPAAPAIHPPLLAALVDRLAAGGAEVRFTARELDALLPPSDIPDTFELALAPAREPAGAPPGTGWLVGLHAPAGATWGRFAHALGAPMTRALAELARAEQRAGSERVDVAFAPSPGLADLCAHPPVRAAALALTSWPRGAAEMPLRRLALELPAATLVDGRQAVTPSPLARVRSTTAPPGVWQLVVGWSLERQHAPWALTLGPLGGLARTPRFVIDGFVVAPASWRVPARLDAASLADWRARGVPRWVQVGHEDELLPVDLDAPGAAEELASLAAERAWEIWPPLGEEVDASGRRVEVVVAVVNPAVAPRPPERPPLTGGHVVPRGSDDHWRTYKLFAAPDRQDALLLGAIRPALAAAGPRVDAWFFQRYIDPPGPRHHLRLRIRSRDHADLERRLDAALVPAFAARDLADLERTSYHREPARWGGRRGADVADSLFALESDLYCSALDAVPDLDRHELAVRALDAAAGGLGLARAARRALAAACRAPLEPWADPERDADWRRRSRRLPELLSGAVADPLSPLLARHTTAIARLPRALAPTTLPALAHLLCVRFLGPDRAAEAHAVYLWDRAAESLLARARRR